MNEPDVCRALIDFVVSKCRDAEEEAPDDEAIVVPRFVPKRGDGRVSTRRSSLLTIRQIHPPLLRIWVVTRIDLRTLEVGFHRTAAKK